MARLWQHTNTTKMSRARNEFLHVLFVPVARVILFYWFYVNRRVLLEMQRCRFQKDIGEFVLCVLRNYCEGLWPNGGNRFWELVLPLNRCCVFGDLQSFGYSSPFDQHSCLQLIII